MNEEQKPRIVYFQGANGDWFFHLRAGQGEVQFASEGYRDKTDAERGAKDAYENFKKAMEDG